MNDTTIYNEAVCNLLEVNDFGPPSPAEHLFINWAATNIRSFEQCFWEVAKARAKAANIHPALHILLAIEATSDEPLPFLI